METDNKLCFMGEKPVLKNSVIENMGENNILFCEKNVVLVNSKIDFRGSDSLIYLSSSRCENDTYIFKQSVNHTIDFEEIDVKLSNKQASLEKLNYLLKLIQTDEKNRFAIM